jgi:hypothetical protein
VFAPKVVIDARVTNCAVKPVQIVRVVTAHRASASLARVVVLLARFANRLAAVILGLVLQDYRRAIVAPNDGLPGHGEDEPSE